MSLWNVEDYVRLRSGGDDPPLEEFALRHLEPGADVLEIGCGPGRAAAALALRHGVRMTAVDASAEMLAAARSHAPDVRFVEAHAEELPFDDASYDAALAQMVVHLLERPRAFSELHRVLRPGGVLWLKSADPSTVVDHWLARLFPSFAAIDVARFPDAETLAAELRAAGFGTITVERLGIPRRFSKQEALERLRTDAFSTLRLLPPEERAEGTARAERELADEVGYELRLLSVTAQR